MTDTTASRYKKLTRIWERFAHKIRLLLENIFTTALKNPFYQFRQTKKLIIFDDHFPLVYSAFRFVEYTAYLEHFPESEIHSNGMVPEYHKNRVQNFRNRVKEFEKQYSHLKSKVIKFNKKRRVKGRLGYTVFLNNAFDAVGYFEMNKIPFIFTLYPGGGFSFENELSDQKLFRVCSSPMFRKMIISQKNMFEYVSEKKVCSPGKIEMLYGGIRPVDKLNKAISKKLYKQDKDTFDICFVAGKYKNIDKGYDVFIDVARLLADKYMDINFHVVGGYCEHDKDVSDLRDRIRFYGYKTTAFFPEFHSRMDIILSPNSPSKFHFDGFPTGCCSEAALCGVAVFCTDCLNMNTAFKDGEDIVIISRNAEDICGVISGYYKNVELLYNLARNGQGSFRNIFDKKRQINKRIMLIEEHMSVDEKSCNHNIL